MEFKNYRQLGIDFTNLREQLPIFKSLLHKNMRIMQKRRNIGKYSHQSYNSSKTYSIKDYIENFDTEVHTVFCNIWTFSTIVAIEINQDRYIFAHKALITWRIVSIDSSKFNEIFPTGIPTTNHAFQKWVNYIGWKAKRFYYTKAFQESERNRLYGNDVKEFKQLAHLLYKSGVNVEELLKEVKND